MSHHDTPIQVDSQAILNQLVLEHLRDKRRHRIWKRVKWGILSVIILWLLIFFVKFSAQERKEESTPHVGLIDVKGAIFEGQSASADNVIKGLEKAYENKALNAIILRIDSPGGSPVQADYMYNAIHHYRDKYKDVKIIAVCVDACASAAYYVASAADDIYANPSSLVGSIGVLYNGFGFVDAMQKLGVSRRLYVAGLNKGFMDPFSPTQPTDKAHLQTMLNLVHVQFIEKVKAGRGKRLKVDKDTFSGLFWTGVQAKDRGLIDGFASSGQVAREILKLDKVVDYTYQSSILERFSKTMGAAMANQLPEALGMKPGLQ
ncbi:MAG: S49 family peptidase [Legionellales bacterium]|nr:S49 family peptidase [Legionellales bacterium]